MKKLTLLYFLLFCSCSLKASVVEKLYFAKDLSGTYTFELNTEKSSFLFRIMDKISPENENFKAQNYEKFHMIAESIKSVSGIKHLKLSFTQSFSKITINLHFENIKALNECFKIMYGSYLKSSISIKKGRLLRIFDGTANSLIDSSESSNKKYAHKHFLKDITIKTEYSFENMSLRKPTSGFSEISDNKKRVVYNYYLLEILSKKVDHSIYLTFLKE